MDSDGDKIYTKIIDLDEIYNFVVQIFFIWSHLGAQIIDKCSDLKFNFGSEACDNYLSTKMVSNKKYLNYKVIDLVEIYNLCIKFIFIRVQIN